VLTSGGEEQQRLEKPSDLGTDNRGLVRYWLMEIDNAGQVMKHWEDDADRICKKYRDENRNIRLGNRFNILAANINTMRPALYNSTPIPDIRRRNQGVPDPTVRDAAAVMERAVSLSMEDGRFDDAIKSTIMDMLQGGRGVARVRNTPLMDGGEAVWYSVCAERVPWRDFRHQPESDWALVNWCAFRHFLDREQLEELNPAAGSKVRLDHTVAAEDRGGNYGHTQQPTDVFKRAVVWEIWDKRSRRCLFIAPSWKRGPLKIEDDPLRLEQFFPVAPPIWADKDPDSMIPLPDFRLYEDLANELDEITRRIQALIRVCRWRGLYNASMGALAALESADDGELKPVDMIDPTVSIDSYVWLMPVERVVQVLQQLYEQRQQILATIYEITGLSDIIRGNTDPNETLGSQRIKAQWATGKLSNRQAEVQRLCRDLIRLKAEIIVEHWPPEVLSAMTGIMVTPQVAQLLTSDQLRMWHIDVETDSTIQADLADARENIGQLIEGIGSFVQAFAPAVQAGLASGGDAVKLMAAFSKPFRLGRQAEQVFDEMVAKAEQQEQQPQEPAPDPAMIEIQGKMQIEQQKLEQGDRHKAAELQLEYMKAGLDGNSQQTEQMKGEMELGALRHETAIKAQMLQMEFAAKQAEAAAAQNMRRIEQQESFAKAQAEIIKANAEAEAAKAAAAQAQAEAMVAAEVARQQAEIAMQAERDKAEVANLEAKAAAAKASAEAQLAVAQAEAESQLAAELAQRKAEVALQMERDRAAAEKMAIEAKLREDMALAESARRQREIEEKALIRQKEAELAIVESQAAQARIQAQAAAADMAARQAAEAAEIQRAQAEQQMMADDKARMANLDAEAAAAKAQAEAQLAMAQAQAEAQLAAELAQKKAEIALQMEHDKAAAAKAALEAKLREEMAVAEAARRQREIEEKVLIRTKEAELAIIESQAAAARSQAQAASAEMAAKQETGNTELQAAQVELQAVREKAQFDADQRDIEVKKAEMFAKMMQQQADLLRTLVTVVTAPKAVVRDREGNIIGTQAVIDGPETDQ
jgi:hypothetical protein